MIELAGGKTLVLLGSRGDGSWLAPQTFEDNVYELPGLDAEAASTLANRVLERHKATGYRGDVNLEKLLKLLEGYPLALEVVLSNLARQTPQEVLQALESGDARIDPQQGTGDQTLLRTRSLLACIGYSHSNLSPEAQQLLLCLAPFTSMINRDWLIGPYSEQLKKQPELAHLPFQRWEEVLAEAVHWGLLTPDSTLPMYLRAQPIFPYFLRTRLQDQPPLARVIETAFRLNYSNVGGALSQWISSKDPQERQTGQVLIEVEYEDLMTALRLTLAGYDDFSSTFTALSSFFEGKQYHSQALALHDMILAAVAKYPLEYYQHALQIKIAFNDRYSQASTYHQLGRVAQEQRQWKEAQEFLLKSLEIFGQLNDAHYLAITLRNLAQLWKESNDSNLVSKVASILGTTPAEAEERLRAALSK